LFCDLASEECSGRKLHLVMGNHDFLSYWHYDRAGLTVHKNDLLIEPFLLSHKP
jgi:metallophosphoesterase superfamily enzyme